MYTLCGTLIICNTGKCWQITVLSCLYIGAHIIINGKSIINHRITSIKIAIFTYIDDKLSTMHTEIEKDKGSIDAHSMYRYLTQLISFHVCTIYVCVLVTGNRINITWLIIVSNQILHYSHSIEFCLWNLIYLTLTPIAMYNCIYVLFQDWIIPNVDV